MRDKPNQLGTTNITDSSLNKSIQIIILDFSIFLIKHICNIFLLYLIFIFLYEFEHRLCF